MSEIQARCLVRSIKRLDAVEVGLGMIVATHVHMFSYPSLPQRELKARLLQKAAEYLEARVDDLSIEDGKMWVRGSPQRKVGLDELAQIVGS